MTQYVLGAITTCVVLEFVSPVPLDFDLFFEFDFEGALLGSEVGSGDLSCCLLRRFSSFLPTCDDCYLQQLYIRYFM